MRPASEIKREFRKTIKAALCSLDAEVKRASDRAICEQVLRLPEFRDAQTVFLFVGVGWEINTLPLIADALTCGKTIAIPLCTAPGIMAPRIIRSTEDLQAGAYRIPEPKPCCRRCDIEAIGFAVIPCIACDRTGRRLGQGGGFYDRLLERADFPTAAVCRSTALLDRVPTEPWDIPVDLVVTETEIYRA